MELITSRQNSLLVDTHKLSDRKHRVRQGAFRFDGVKLAAEALSRGVDVRAVLLRQTDAEDVCARVRSMSGKDFSSQARVIAVSDDVFDRLSEENAPEGIICVARMQQDIHRVFDAAGDLPSLSQRVMLLESVRDPANLGAIIRSAAAFGVDRLILSEDCADIYHPRAVRASMGTLFSQRIDRTDDLVGAITALRASGRRVLAAALDERAERLGQMQVRSGDCAVIGNEGHGLDAATVAACDASVMIPMTQRAESLNAAVAASLLMWGLMPHGSV